MDMKKKTKYENNLNAHKNENEIWEYPKCTRKKYENTLNAHKKTNYENTRSAHKTKMKCRWIAAVHPMWQHRHAAPPRWWPGSVGVMRTCVVHTYACNSSMFSDGWWKCAGERRASLRFNSILDFFSLRKLPSLCSYCNILYDTFFLNNARSSMRWMQISWPPERFRRRHSFDVCNM